MALTAMAAISPTTHMTAMGWERRHHRLRQATNPMVPSRT